MILEFSRLVFEKYSYIGFYENPSSRSEVLHADRQTRRNQQSLFAILRTRLKTGECYSLFLPKLHIQSLCSA